MEQRIARWYLANVKALKRIYGHVKYDRDEFSWIYIKDFILPDCFNQKTSALLLTTPGEDLMRPSGFNFYLNQNLRRRDGQPTGRIYENKGFNHYYEYGYAWICLHINDFRPRSDPRKKDNILDLCQTLYNFVGDKRGIL